MNSFTNINSMNEAIERNLCELHRIKFPLEICIRELAWEAEYSSERKIDNPRAIKIFSSLWNMLRNNCQLFEDDQKLQNELGGEPKAQIILTIRHTMKERLNRIHTLLTSSPMNCKTLQIVDETLAMASRICSEDIPKLECCLKEFSVKT